ncbi:hypothetical protein [Psychrobacter lutiphocae]|uniref:hypothetical protein n=1 Tax=Psychrobacter lutiphocae TaxID=540500 RepID=UPI0003A1D6C7|nr:hypothetical protein [Psychrobacter lutiphocae]
MSKLLKTKKSKSSLLFYCAMCTLATPALAENASQPTNKLTDGSLTTAITAINDEAAEWIDDHHEDVQDRLRNLAHSMDKWFGEPDPQKPASANLRVVFDTRWSNNPTDGSHVTVKPRIRGHIKLPVLERRLSIVIGDKDLDEQDVLTKGSAYGAGHTPNQSKVLDGKQVREDNASIALRWSKLEDTFGFDTDVGIRSGNDLFLKFSVDKDLHQTDTWQISNHNYYRYGTDSEHTLKGEINTQYKLSATRYFNNNINLRYRHEDDREQTTWGNEVRHIHYFNNNKQLSYGLSSYGYLEDGRLSLNSYGPTVSYRQPFWRDWLFLQTEFSYFNDKKEDKSHFPSTLLRIEALF